MDTSKKIRHFREIREFTQKDIPHQGTGRTSFIKIKTAPKERHS